MGLQPDILPPDSGHLNDVVAEEVRALMARRRMSQDTVAKALGISQSQLSKRLLGKVVFDLGEVQKLADFFAVDVAELVTGTTHRRPPTGGPDGGNVADLSGVRHQGLEPRTRWFRGSDAEFELAA